MSSLAHQHLDLISIAYLFQRVWSRFHSRAVHTSCWHVNLYVRLSVCPYPTHCTTVSQIRASVAPETEPEVIPQKQDEQRRRDDVKTILSEHVNKLPSLVWVDRLRQLLILYKNSANILWICIWRQIILMLTIVIESIKFVRSKH